MEPVRLYGCHSLLPCPRPPSRSSPSLPDGESCTKAPVAPAGYKFTQGKDNYGSNIQCATLGDVTGQMGEASGSWPELAALCSATGGCAAVSLYATNTSYDFCLKSTGVGLQNTDSMNGFCLGILVKA